MYYGVLGVWLVCSLLSYGAILAFFEREYVDRTNIYWYENRIIAVLICISGPVGLLLAFVATKWFMHGFKLW